MRSAKAPCAKAGSRAREASPKERATTRMPRGMGKDASPEKCCWCNEYGYKAEAFRGTQPAGRAGARAWQAAVATTPMMRPMARWARSSVRAEATPAAPPTWHCIAAPNTANWVRTSGGTSGRRATSSAARHSAVAVAKMAAAEVADMAR